MEIKKVINNFLKEKGYTNDEDIEGIIFYGSYQTETNNTNSDVDLLIIFKDDIEKDTSKCYTKFNGIVFEYFERSLQNIYNRIKHDFYNSEDTLLSVIGHGKILIDNYGNIRKLKDYTLDKFKNGLPKLEYNDNLYYAKALNKSIERLEIMDKENNPYFNIYYGITLDKISSYYNKLNGFSNISPAKIYRTYTNDKYKEAQHLKLPEAKFIKLYLECVEDIKYNNIYRLYEYSIRNLTEDFIDFSNIKINIKNKQY